ncbi:hypothetical protein ACQ858_14915 [Variovorax ureilyticus]|uniref:hypothetical protein n=1 Tax=Variovorax ureilyticus TaxID=1836198 RepID=UPI003D664E61
MPNDNQQQALPTAEQLFNSTRPLQQPPSKVSLDTQGQLEEGHGGALASAAVTEEPVPPRQRQGHGKRHRVDRGASEGLNPRLLQDRIRLEVLTLLNRFRSIRTFDAVVGCFANRGFNAALKAAQRAMGGLKAAGYVNEYLTDRSQHIYGLTERGARYLRARGVDARASVQGVSGKHNPIHQLWASFIVMCSKARQLHAVTEDELKAELNAERRRRGLGKAPGLLRVALPVNRKPEGGNDGVQTPPRTAFLWPDALANDGQDATWFEVDWSKRGGPREKFSSNFSKALARDWRTAWNCATSWSGRAPMPFGSAPTTWHASSCPNQTSQCLNSTGPNPTPST